MTARKEHATSRVGHRAQVLGVVCPRQHRRPDDVFSTDLRSHRAQQLLVIRSSENVARAICFRVLILCCIVTPTDHNSRADCLITCSIE